MHGCKCEQMCMAVKTHSKQEAGREAGATAPEVKSAPRISILQVFLEGFLSLLMTRLRTMASNPPGSCVHGRLGTRSSRSLRALLLFETPPFNQTLPQICKGLGEHWDKHGAIHNCKAHAVISSQQMRAQRFQRLTDVAELEFQPRPSKRRFHSTPGTSCSALHRYHVSLQIEGLWRQPCIEPVYWGHFTDSICPLHVSVSYFGNSCSISNIFIFIVFAMVTGDL